MHRYLILILATIVVLIFVFPVSDAQISTACNACKNYSMTCLSTQKIRLNALYAGYSTIPQCSQSSLACSNPSICCRYAQNTILEQLTVENTYTTYTMCSGREICDNILPPQQEINGTMSSFVHLEYACEEADAKISLCGGGPNGFTSGQYSSTDIFFNGSPEALSIPNASAECKCEVKSLQSGTKLTLTIIDLRMARYNSSECSSALLSIDGTISTRCVTSQFPYQHNFRYNEQHSMVVPDNTTTNIYLQYMSLNGLYDVPAMVWINLKEVQGKQFSLTCGQTAAANLPPTLPPTTTSTTTTTPKPTTTTTTPKPTTTTTTPKPTTTTTAPKTTTTTTTPKTTTTTTTPKTTTTTTTPKTTTTTTTPKTTTTTTTPKTTTTTTTPKPTTTTTTPNPTTTTTTPKPTTTTTTPKPTTTTPKPTTIPPKPTTIPPKPTTIPPKPTTTTPKPTTTTTTPKPTTTTTIPPKPTTTTPKPTTTTPKPTTTTPKPTTTTPKPTTTTPKPTTTTTTPKPTTTTPKSTTSTTTKTSRPALTTTLTAETSESTQESPSTTNGVLTTINATTTFAIEPERVVAVSDNDDDDRNTILMAILIPIAASCIFIGLFILYLCHKRNKPKGFLFNFMQRSQTKNAYQTFADRRILERFIRQQGIRSGSSMASNSVVNLTKAEDYEREISDRNLALNESISDKEQSSCIVQPYSIPIPILRTSSTDEIDGKPTKPRHSTVYHVRFQTDYPISVSDPESVNSDTSRNKYRDENNENNRQEFHYHVVKPAVEASHTQTDGLAVNVADLQNQKVQVFHPVIHLPTANDSMS